MLTKALSLLLITLLGLALGLETARYVHTHTAGVGVSGTVAGANSMVNIHRAVLGFSLLAISGALLLSLRSDGRGRGGLGVGAWLSRQWLSFTARLELTLDGLFDFDALNVGDGMGSSSAFSESTRGLRLTELYIQRIGQGSASTVRQHDWRASNAAIHEHMKCKLNEPCPPDDGLLPCRGCSWCGVDPGNLPDELWTECDGSGRYLPSTEAERKRQLAQPKSVLRSTEQCKLASREGRE